SMMSLMSVGPLSLLQGVAGHGADRPWFAVAAALDVVDFPAACLVHERVAHDLILECVTARFIDDKLGTARPELFSYVAAGRTAS
ncbi:hypothetical protein, partial [Bradyrhizobium sp.]|uniref:hypothetical protein n=1 Tax=Bradyrhizobium sp. TaxID=376 RepID=UPI003C373F3D